MAISSTLCCATSFEEKGEDLFSCYFLGLVAGVYSNKGFSLCQHAPNKHAYCKLISSAQSKGPACRPQEKSFFMFILQRFTWLSFSQFFHSCIVMMCIGVKLKEELGFGYPVSRVCIPINEENVVWKTITLV